MSFGHQIFYHIEVILKQRKFYVCKMLETNNFSFHISKINLQISITSTTRVRDELDFYNKKRTFKGLYFNKID